MIFWTVFKMVFQTILKTVQKILQIFWETFCFSWIMFQTSLTVRIVAVLFRTHSRMCCRFSRIVSGFSQMDSGHFLDRSLYPRSIDLSSKDFQMGFWNMSTHVPFQFLQVWQPCAALQISDRHPPRRPDGLDQVSWHAEVCEAGSTLNLLLLTHGPFQFLWVQQPCMDFEILDEHPQIGSNIRSKLFSMQRSVKLTSPSTHQCTISALLGLAAMYKL